MLVARAAERKRLQSVLTTNSPERRQQQIALEARAAERHFDSALGRCNWESVANELDIPLIECLDLFDASNSTIQPRSLIETYGGWSKTDMEKLKQFTADNYADGSVVDWKLAGAYMNIHSKEYQAGLSTERLTAEWTDAERERVKDLINQQIESTTIPELVDIIKRELLNKPLSEIRLFSNQYVKELKAGLMRVDQIA
ncbi:hypothetical protein H4R27_003118 [Coemansia aciculifera]|nr:hypothetical protein H4R27_003118 [Coemansia aciculifera]